MAERPRLKRWALTAAAVGAALGLAGFLVMASGIIPIQASSGHFAITEWLLVFAKERSLSTHTLGMDPLRLDPPWLVEKGARHFESGCRPCHGAPDLLRQPRVARSMLPPPPSLSLTVAKYDPEELFYIVKHGIKFTGMPAWPSQARDDEVTAVVAFLLELPKLDPVQYHRLSHGPAASSGATDPLEDLVEVDPRQAEPAPRAVQASCARCHGARGDGRGSAAFPKLAGQTREYLVASLEAYASDARHSGMMQPSAAALGPDEMRELAEYFSRFPRERANVGAFDPAALERGSEIASRGIPERRVPSCSDCHGPGPGRRDPELPVLAAQHADYLLLQLELFAKGTRGGSTRAHLMRAVAPRMTRQQMQDVALYYASLSAAPRR